MFREGVVGWARWPSIRGLKSPESSSYSCQMSELMNKTALVTGGAKGLGACVVRSFAEQGAELLILGRDGSSLEQIKRTYERSAQPGRVKGIYRCDMGHIDEIEATVTQIHQDGHEVDVLVNNAGIAEGAPFERGDMQLWDRAMRVNAQGPALLSARLLPSMKARGYGRIINIGSVLALDGAREVSAYAASKHALLGWSRCLALELAGTGVTVNTLCPGYIDTSIFEAAKAAIIDKVGQDHDRATGALLKSLGQRRLLSPQEVAAWVLRLAQDAGTINGESIRLSP